MKSVYSAVRTGSLNNLPSAHTVYLRVLCGSENKQRLFPYTTLTDWFHNRDNVRLLGGRDHYTYNICQIPSLYMNYITYIATIPDGKLATNQKIEG
jgi:hypothetical protein